MWGFTKHPDSGATDQQTKVACFEAGSTLKGTAIERHLDNALRNQIETLCANRSRNSAHPTAVPPTVIPIVVAAGRFLFDQFAERRLKEVEELKTAASQSYSSTVIFESGAQLRKQVAVLLIRHKDGDDTATFAALLKVRQRGSGKAFTIEPIYVRASNAVAITSKDAGAISASLALAIKSLTKGKDGPVALVASGQGAVTVAKLEIGAKTNPFVCADDCPGSDLIPYPPFDEPCSVSFAVTETGDLGFDIDAKIAERKALKEALGPAITEAFTVALKEKEE
jgi:hypothetical protein